MLGRKLQARRVCPWHLWLLLPNLLLRLQDMVDAGDVGAGVHRHLPIAVWSVEGPKPASLRHCRQIIKGARRQLALEMQELHLFLGIHQLSWLRT